MGRYRRDHSTARNEEELRSESAEIRRLRAELRNARMENEFLKKSSSVLREGAEVTRKVRDHSPPGAQLPGRTDVPVGRSIEVRLLQLAQQAGVGDHHQKTQTGTFHQD